jgi:peptide/nickel transport system substrate-binding protein
MRKWIGMIAGMCAATTVLASCTSSSGTSGPIRFVSGGTFNFAMSADPGNLDPQASAASNFYQMSFLAYDPLLSVDLKGQIHSQLATKWRVSGNKVVLTLHEGITCSDGSKFTASTAARNVSYVADPNTKSPFAGVFIPAGTKATADDTANTVTLTTPTVAPFVLDGLAGVPMVCGKAISNRKLLATRTSGTGPYALSQAVSNDHYTLTKRKGYAWGPSGATTATTGLPDSIVVKIIPNQTTAASLLLSGQLNAVVNVLGPDVSRLKAANLFNVGTPAVLGEMWFNHDAGRLGADPKVRPSATSEPPRPACSCTRIPSATGCDGSPRWATSTSPTPKRASRPWSSSGSSCRRENTNRREPAAAEPTPRPGWSRQSR